MVLQLGFTPSRVLDLGNDLDRSPLDLGVLRHSFLVRRGQFSKSKGDIEGIDPNNRTVPRLSARLFVWSLDH